jgi:hypothetical protein
MLRDVYSDVSISFPHEHLSRLFTSSGNCHSSLLLPVLRDLVPLTHERHHEPWKTVRRYTFVIFLVGQYHSRLDTSTIPE